ncbi:hypothetical protein SCANM63S_04461 [Streptomyces canarius]
MPAPTRVPRWVRRAREVRRRGVGGACGDVTSARSACVCVCVTRVRAGAGSGAAHAGSAGAVRAYVPVSSPAGAVRAYVPVSSPAGILVPAAVVLPLTPPRPSAGAAPAGRCGGR